MPAIGIDSGSVAVKGVLMEGEEVVEVVVEETGADPGKQCNRMISRLRGSNPTGAGAAVCATGYGREAVEEAAESVSEIFANALGTGWAWRNWHPLEVSLRGKVTAEVPIPSECPKQFRTIVDVGGQDTKVITFGAGGVVEGFAMNDRCAAGTGRFLEELTSVLELDGVPELDRLAGGSERPASISSACTVFAESEVVSLIASGIPRADIASGIFRSIADRVGKLAESLRWRGPILLDGNTARLAALREALEHCLEADISVPPLPQHITAIGAALFLETESCKL